MNWPQVIVIVMLTARCASCINLHGRTVQVNAAHPIAHTALFVWLLWVGGFFS